jgi:hypothetical protein
MSLRHLFGRFVRVHPALLDLSFIVDNWLRGSRVTKRGTENCILLKGVRMVRTRICMEGSGNVLRIMPGTRLFDSHILIRGQGHRVEIGRDCVFDRLQLNVETRDTKVSIGDDTDAASLRIDIVEPDLSVRTGNDCMISRGVEILCTDSHSLLDAATGRRLNPPKSVEIGEHVWLGAYSIVLKGATIGSHSVIGLRSTVGSKIPPGVIAVGNPAKVIRTGVTWHRELR